MSENEKKKKSFRNSKAWLSFRHEMIVRDKIDYITGRKLLKGCQVHHLNLDPEQYKDLNQDNFITLNKNTHSFIHWLFDYYKKDKGILKRIELILEKMYNLNCK